jgi:hypothetical protein
MPHSFCQDPPHSLSGRLKLIKREHLGGASLDLLTKPAICPLQAAAPLASALEPTLLPEPS